MASQFEPKGPTITGPPALPPSPSAKLEGKHVTLIPLSPTHASALYTSVGGPSNTHLYTYLSHGPFPTLAPFEEFIASLTASDPTTLFPFVILKDGNPEGVACFLNVARRNRSIEIGSLLFGERLKRSRAATEAFALMMAYAFEQLGYLRVEWKCNTFNLPSQSAALRLGFVHEGVFRKHMVIKGKGRDSWWGSVVDEEWEGPKEGEALGVRDALDAWLSESNFDGGGKQKRRLGDIRVHG